MDATVYVQSDLQVGLGLNGSVSQTVSVCLDLYIVLLSDSAAQQSPEICIQPNYGINLHGGKNGSAPFARHG
jgi:hypothetical protein